MSLAPVMPFTCIKKHFEGEAFAPVSVAGRFELQSGLSVMVGSNGNPYQFATADNAAKWLDDTLVKTSKSGQTKQAHIDALILKLSATGYDFIQTEIETIEARNAGEWSVYFGDDLLAEYGLVVRGEKGDKGETGAAGANGSNGLNAQGGVYVWQFPIGHILIDAGDTNPNTYLNYGTWVAFGAGQVLVGLDVAQDEFSALGMGGGEKTHTLNENEMPYHRHQENVGSDDPDGAIVVVAGVRHNAAGSNGASTHTGFAGGSQPHNNLQPYIVVKFWKRTA